MADSVCLRFVCTFTLLTCHSEAAQGAGLGMGLTHPLLAALPGHQDLAWHWAVGPRQHHVQVAAWHTGDLPVVAHALVLTAGEKCLAVLIDGAVQNTHISLMSWKKTKCGVNGVCPLKVLLLPAEFQEAMVNKDTLL